MRALILCGLAGCLALSLTGCQLVQGAVDFLVGSAQEPDKVTTVEKVVEVASGIPGPIGVIGGILLSGLNVLQAYQNRKEKTRSALWREGLKGAVVGIDRALEQGEKDMVTKEELYEALKERLFDKVIVDFIASVKAEDRTS